MPLPRPPRRGRTPIHRALLAALAVPLAAAPLTAQQRDTAVVLPAVEVLGSVLPVVGPAVGAGVAGTGRTLSGAELRVAAPRHLGEALRGQPGMSLYDDLGSPFRTTLVTRGFTVSPVVGLPQGMSVFLDGIPVNEPDAGQVNFDLLPLAHLRRVELLSGTASLLGPNSLGGAVNLITRRGGGPAAGEVELSGGSHGRRGAAAWGEGGAAGWSWFGGVDHGREGGWRQLTSARLTSALVNVGRFGARRGVGVQALGARSYAETAGSLPESVYDVRPDSNLSAGDFEDLEQLHVAVTGYAPVLGGRATLTLYHRRHDAERFNVNQEDDPDVRGFSRNRTTGASADWRVDRPMGRGGVLSLRAGAAGSANDVHVRLFAERLDPGLTTDVESPIAKLDGYALVGWQTRRLTLSGGARWDAVRIPYRNLLDRTKDTTSHYRRLSPRVAASVVMARGLSLHASSARGFRAPAVIELACADPEEPCPLPFALGDDPPLAPVVATTHELGGRWTRGRATLGATAFRTDLRDDIFLLPYEDEDEPEGSTIDGYFANVARTRREGVELSAGVQLGAHALYANAGLTRATFRTADVEIFSIREAAGEENEVEVGDRLPLVPDRTLAAGGRIALPARLRLGVDARYTGERWLRGDEANETAPLPGHWLLDLSLAHDAGAWTIQANVHNALDRRVATFGTFNINQGAGDVLERFLTPNQPRALVVTLRRRLGAAE